MTTKERELLDKAITTLICALAHDEAVLHGKDISELAAFRPVGSRRRKDRR